MKGCLGKGENFLFVSGRLPISFFGAQRHGASHAGVAWQKFGEETDRKKNKGTFWKGFTEGFRYPPGNDHISHLGKRKIIFKYSLGGEIVPKMAVFMSNVRYTNIPLNVGKIYHTLSIWGWSFSSNR